MYNIKLRFTGKTPLLLSCDRLANPLLEISKRHKELTSKRKKTDDDHLAIARSQWEGLLYLDENNNVIMPGQNIRAAIVRGAVLNKLGTNFKRGSMVLEDEVLLDYGKKLTVQELWDQKYVDVRSVVVSNSRVMAYRPKFTNWAVDFTLTYDETTLDANQVMQAAKNAGEYIGLGGFRPEKGGNFGRFTVEVLK